MTNSFIERSEKEINEYEIKLSNNTRQTIAFTSEL